jgi:DNA-directed RNA polymerase specialized sigma24 family protein
VGAKSQMTKVDGKRHWEPSGEAFQRLLTWLDEGRDSQGERYVEIRDRLVHYFARRNCLLPEDLADETLNRVARRLEETGSIDDIAPARYCYIVAKFVLLESLRQRARQPEDTWDDQRSLTVRASPDDPPEQRDRIMACLERCLEARTSFERTLILEYYRSAPGPASGRRKQLAERLGLTANSLAIRACRIRSRLEACVRACMET